MPYLRHICLDTAVFPLLLLLLHVREFSTKDTVVFTGDTQTETLTQPISSGTLIDLVNEWEWGRWGWVKLRWHYSNCLSFVLSLSALNPEFNGIKYLSNAFAAFKWVVSWFQDAFFLVAALSNCKCDGKLVWKVFFITRFFTLGS